MTTFCLQRAVALLVGHTLLQALPPTMNPIPTHPNPSPPTEEPAAQATEAAVEDPPVTAGRVLARTNAAGRIELPSVAGLAASQFFFAGLRPCTLLCGEGPAALSRGHI